MRSTLVLVFVCLLVAGGCGRTKGVACDPCCPPCSSPCAPCASLIPGVQDVERPFDTETYDEIQENPFIRVSEAPLSTFAVDVDTASYSNVRRFLNEGQKPPPGAVRIEELVNYFPYDYAPPAGTDPFAVHVDVAGCPWKGGHRLVRIGLKGREFAEGQRPACNLVFLLDVSGSMDSPNKLPLVKRSLQMLVEKLTEADRVAIVVYAGAAGLVLPSTPGSETQTILDALGELEAGGSTNGGEGIQLAYATALENFRAKGVNRVILATDGDFNVGTTSQSELVKMIRGKAAQGVFLTVLGFGMGNYKDSTLEKLADQGNGSYGYVDTAHEARKMLVEQSGGTLVTIAKDVKIQVEFNPAQVAAYRLIGYENRLLAARDFNDDEKDAGEIGAGHTVTALYEIVPAGTEVEGPGVDSLRYQRPAVPASGAGGGELLFVKVRYKQPTGDTSRLLTYPVKDGGGTFSAAPADFRFASSVASFGMLLRNSPHRGAGGFDTVRMWAQGALGPDEGGYRAAFLGLVEKASRMDE